jgi:uncharacterized repeat protein (TIGR01451 family)
MNIKPLSSQPEVDTKAVSCSSSTLSTPASTSIYRWFKIFTAALWLAAIAAFVQSRAIAAQPRATAIHVPVIINVYSNCSTNVTSASIADAIAEANRILGQAGIRLEPVRTNNPVTAPNNGDNGDGAFSLPERNAMRTFGGQELATNVPGGKGIKLSFGNAPDSTNANVLGYAIHRNPTVILRQGSSSNQTGQVIAHEVGHVMTLGKNHMISSNLVADDEGHVPTNSTLCYSNLMCPYAVSNATNLTPAQIDELRREWLRVGMCTEQFSNAFPALRARAQSGATTDQRGDAHSSTPGFDGGVSAIYDLNQVFITSRQEKPDMDVLINVSGVLPEDEPIHAVYSLGLDTDNDLATGGPFIRVGIDKVITITVAGQILGGDFVISGTVQDLVTGMITPLPGPFQWHTESEVPDGGSSATPAATSFMFSVPKAMLNLAAQYVPVIAASGMAVEIYDTAEFTLNMRLWLDEPGMQTFGNGSPKTGVPYPFTLSGMAPNSPLRLYLDDQVVFSGNLDLAGNCAGSFVLPADMQNTSMHFLTARDNTPAFAYGMTCPQATFSVAIRSEGESVRLSFETINGVEYLVERTFSLNVPLDWLPFRSVLGTGGEVIVEDGLTVDNHFYRVRMAPFDLSARQNILPNPVQTGQEMTITIMVAHESGVNAANVQVYDPLPEGVEFMGAEAPAPATCTFSNGMVVCNLATMIPGQSVPITLRVIPLKSGTITNTVIVTADGFDSNSENDFGSAHITVLEKP